MPGYNAQWQLPVGELETTETISEGIEREVLEETGFKVRVDTTQPIYIGESKFN